MAAYSDDTLRGLLDVLLQLEKLLGQMEGKPTQPLTVVAGQGRGSRKPKANLQSVEN